MNQIDNDIELADLMIARLERLSADSVWAHKASGLRNSLLRCLANLEAAREEAAPAAVRAHLKSLIRHGFTILENAAREIETPELDDRHST